jgi:hypothetical protein
LRAVDFLGVRLSRLGERTGRDWLVYNPVTMWSYHRLAKRDAKPVMRAVAQVFPGARSYVDVGAGTGSYSAAARGLGVHAVALERSLAGRLAAKLQRVTAKRFDLSEPRTAPVRADLAFCFEVAEHLVPELGENLVEFLAAAAPVVVFTAAHPGQGGWAHINEQEPEYWVARFERAGMHLSRDETDALRQTFAAEGVSAPWLSANLLVFRSIAVRAPQRITESGPA